MKKKSSKTSRRRMAAAVILAGGVLAASVALAEDVWVKSSSVDIRTGKGSIYPVIKNVPKGTQLNVVAHEGPWLKVQIDDQQGYVFQNAISGAKVDGSGNLLASVGSGADASDVSTGAAARGFNETVTTYANGKNMDPNLLQRLIDFDHHLGPKQWEQFAADGKVGPNTP